VRYFASSVTSHQVSPGSARPVAPHFRFALGALELVVRSLFAVFLRRAGQRFALLYRNAVSSFGLRDGDLCLAFGLRLARFLCGIGDCVAVAFLLRFHHVLLGIRHFFLCVGLRVRQIALGLGLGVPHVGLDLIR